MKKKIILASASPRRSHLMQEWGLPFVVKPSHADESTHYTAPAYLVRELALRKALSVAEDIQGGIVVGADTIVVLKGEIIGKPRDTAHAHRILSNLNGSWHRVYTGVAVVDAASGRFSVDYEVSRVKMRRFSADEIRRLAGKHLDKAGAYAVQEQDDAFVERIEGDYFNVVGLPFDCLARLLKPYGFKPKKA